MPDISCSVVKGRAAPEFAIIRVIRDQFIVKAHGRTLLFQCGLQTADIDMTLVDGYSGTSANGNAKCYFAGIYNGGGHTLKVNINDDVQRSVFPYVYGAIVNLKIQGRIVSEASAQPVRTLYGAVVNCIFELDLKAERTHGGYYSH